MSLKSDLILAHLAALPGLHGEASASEALEEIMIDYMLKTCPDAECSTCAELTCPHGDLMHFHHDGCPACSLDEST